MNEEPDQNPWRPQIPFPEPGRPVLDYRTPQPRQQDPHRGRAVAKGFAAVWLCLAIAIGCGAFAGFRSFQAGLVLPGMAFVVYGAFDARNKRHAGFIVGMILGVLMVIGIGMLVLTVLCGR